MALEICTSVVSEIVNNILNETIHQALYPFQFQKYVEELIKEKENLLLQIESIHNRVKKAEQDAQKIDILVMKWLDEADTLIADAVSLEEKAKTNESCCLPYCPNLIWRGHLAKQIEKKIKEIVDQGNKHQFEQFARPATPPGIEYYSSEGFFLFDSTKLAYDQLWEALKDDEVSLVGLYGMGGCGKTTLAKQVGKASKELFSKVLFVVVSSYVDIPSLQDSIASELGVQLEGQVVQGKAKILWSKLNNAGNILIILDDVWEKLDFEAIGIPIGTNFNSCKVLLTTRRQQVCALMDCQRTVPLLLLNEEEAWRLFQHYARITSLTPNSMKNLANQIAHECKGLTIAIATVASTLRGKNLGEWDEALETLRDFGWMNIEEGLRDPYKCLMLSYENLKDEDVKSIFLLCSIFPEDSEIEEEDLARYVIGLGLFGRLISFRRARNKLSVAKDRLIDSSLLMETEDGQCVKMHDLVRDVALWIAKEENREIASGKRNEETMQVCGSMEHNKIRYLWLNEVHSFPSQLHFPNLTFLHVGFQNKSFFTYDCFKELLELRVLVLNIIYLVIRPNIPFLDSLTNLHCLHLDGWELGDISFMGSLRKLQSVKLRRCSFNCLPNEILELESLKLLDVRLCKIKENPYEVMGKCSKLEELYFNGNNGQWVDEQEHACDLFVTKVYSPKLLRYHIEIGRHFGVGYYFWTSVRSIAVEQFEASATNETIKDLVGRAESLCLRRSLRGCKNVIPEMIQRIGRIEDLTTLVLDDFENLEFLFDHANHGYVEFENVFSKLIWLEIIDMKSLRAFYRGTCLKADHMLNMSNLKVFKLYHCPLVTHVFTFATAESLPMLEALEVSGCDGLKEILTDEKEHNQQRSNLVFQKLKRLYVGNCEKMEYLITRPHNKFQSLQLASLNELRLWKMPNLISIFSENYNSRCPSLKFVIVSDYNRPNIMSINDLVVGRATLQELGSTVTHSTQIRNEAVLLQTLQVVGYIQVEDSGIEYVFQLTGLPLNVEPTPLESGLEYLRLNRLYKLRCIFNGPTQCMSLQNLSAIDIFGCTELRCIFTYSIVRDLHRLQFISIEQCDKLEQIIEGEDATGNLEATSSSSTPPIYGSQNIGSFNLCSLRVIKVIGCPKLKWLFTLSTAKTLTSLEELTIEGSGELQYVIKEDERVEASKSEGTVYDDGQAMLQNLQELTLYGCVEIRSIFSVSFVGSLPKLRSLTIANCYKLEQIIKGEESFGSLETTSNFSASSHGSQNKGSFNLCSLEVLHVIDCDMLKWLFTISTAITLTSLKNLKIEGCEGLEYVIKDKRVEANTSEGIVYDDGPTLHPRHFYNIYLNDIPNPLKYFEVWHCPKLFPKRPVEGTKTASEDENGEVKKDSEDDIAVEEENKLVPYDLNKAAKNIILESENQLEWDFSLSRTSNLNNEAGPSGEAAPELSKAVGVTIPGLPLKRPISLSSTQIGWLVMLMLLLMIPIFLIRLL